MRLRHSVKSHKSPTGTRTSGLGRNRIESPALTYWVAVALGRKLLSVGSPKPTGFNAGHVRWLTLSRCKSEGCP